MTAVERSGHSEQLEPWAGRRALSRRQLLRGVAVLGGGAALSAFLASCGGENPTAATGGPGGATTGATAAATSAGAQAAPTTAATRAPSPAAGGGGSPPAGGAASPAATRAGSPVAGASPAAGAAAPPVASGPKLTKNASIVEWGFGEDTAETNPLAFYRIQAFRQQYPNIQLELVPKTDDQKILTAAASKTLPELLWLGRADLSQWAARGVLRAVDDFIDKDKFDTSRFYEAALDEVKYDKKIYGIPQFMTARGLYVNTDALQEAGADAKTLNTGDWDALTSLAGKLVKKSGDKVDRWGLDHKMQPQAGWLWQWGSANGGKFLSDDLKKASYNDPKIVEALDWGVKNYEAQGGYKAYQAASSTWQNDEQFARGLVAMTMYENFMLGIIARVQPDRNFVVLAPRKRNGGATDWITFTGGNAWMITSGAKDPEAAWEFIKFMCQPDTWMIGANGTKEIRKKANQPYVPTLTADKIADQLQIERVYEPIAAKFDDAIKLWPQILDKSIKVPVSGSPVSKQLTDDLNNLGAKPAFEGERGAKDALEQANRKAQDDIDSFRP